MSLPPLQQFGFARENTNIQSFGSGLINHTWLIESSNKKYILQRINQKVFTNPSAIDENIQAIARYLQQNYPGYCFTVPLRSIHNESLVKTGGDFFRLFNFIESSHSYDTVQHPQLAYEAAKQFGKFTNLLSGFDALLLKITIPDFHNLTLRYRQFEEAISHAAEERIYKAGDLVETLKANRNIVSEYEHIQHNPFFKIRVTHHDTKISNVLFDINNKGICVIDLDTVMPGYFISDVGDMMRTYLSAAGEEETDLSAINIREDYFDAIVHGYLSEMQDELTSEETNAFVYAGKFMIYMQALRFLADFLNNDIYYGAKYELHNYNRAANQIALLNALMEKEDVLHSRVDSFLNKTRVIAW